MKIAAIAGAAMAATALAAGVAAAPASPRPGQPASDAWAYPAATPPPPPGGWSAAKTLRVPGFGALHSPAELHDRFQAVVWRPKEAVTPPSIVLRGRPPDAMACGFCHLPDGQGRPENAALAGLPAAYIARQVADMRAGLRTGAHPDWPPTTLMRQTARGVSPDEAAMAANYFSRLKFVSRTRVLEADRIPRATPDFGFWRIATGGATELLGQRIVEGPADLKRFEMRDGRTAIVAFVPPGSIAAGRVLASGKAGVEGCADCHGDGLRGVDLMGSKLKIGGAKIGAVKIATTGPPLAGRSPSYLFRQLRAFQGGGRRGPNAEPMRTVTAKLTREQMLDLAAYAGALRP